MHTLAHHIKIIEDSAFFSNEDYENTYQDVAYSGMTPAEHYLRVGAFIGRNPSEDFDSVGYLSTYLDVTARRDNPLVHYELHGRGEGRSPKPAPVNGKARKPVSVDVVVPVYNALEDVQACLRSLAAVQNGFPMRALIINDGSDEDTTQWLREACATLGTETVTYELIEHEENKGYTVAVNTGLKASDAAYVVTLNSDTIVTDFWLDGLIRCLRSDPKIGVVGPMSNAASWQNVPDLYGADKKFAINALPKGMDANDMAAVVRRVSRRVYPRSTFVNGFCFMITREVLNAVCYMDEGAFPMGYGEENDFCIRVQDAGYTLAFADDTYVFHAKSKSFGTARKEALSKAGSTAIKEKHGPEKFAELVRQVADTSQMDEIRAPIKRALQDRNMTVEATTSAFITGQKMLFVLPVKGGGGGAHSVIQEVTAMRTLGVTAKVAVREQDFPDFMRLYGDIDNAEELFVPFTDDTLLFVARDFDVAVATIFTSAKLVKQIVDALPWILPAYYAQDYEPMFFDHDDPLYKEALDSYTLIPGACTFAKTHWIGKTIEEHHDVRVHKVEPSIDHSVYSLTGPKVADDAGGLCITAMIRPRTPRRGAERTMELLGRLKQAHGDALTVRIFGCDESSAEYQNLPRDFDFVNHGILTRPEVAALLRSADLFIDLSDYQAFGRTGLEAMACGTLSAVPDAGGGREYAIDGVNALIVDTLNVDACFDRINPLLKQPEQMALMQLAAIDTASKYSPRRAAVSELILLAPALSAWRKKHPKPLDRVRVAIMSDDMVAGEARYPGIGNERLPAPYCAADLIPEWDVQIMDQGVLPDPGAFDMAVIQGKPSKQHGPELAAWLKEWRRLDKRLVYDLGNQTQLVEKGLLGPAHVLCVSSDTVADQLRALVPDNGDKIHVVPTYLDRSTWCASAPKARAHDTLTIGYFGTEDNLEDIRQIRSALEAVQNRDNVSLQVVGCYQKADPIVGDRVGYLKRRDVEGFRFEEFVEWLKEVAQWDIIIVPDATDTRVKLMRSAALGGAIVCRDTAEVSDIAQHGENCLLVDETPENWEKALSELLENAELRLKLAENAWRCAYESWTMQANSEIYANILQGALDAK